LATKDEVVSAITHIENLLHTDNWRGALNNSDYQRLKAILEDQTSGDTWVPDSLIGALRNQWPKYFDPKTGTELTPAPDPPPPLTAPPPAPGPPPPGPSGPTPPPGSGGDDMSGQAAAAAKKLDAALAKNHSALNDADVQLTDAILAATAADEHSRGQLDALKQSVIDQVTRIGPEALQTRAGMEELATFLQNKTSDILNVVRNAHLDSQSQAKVMDALAARYSALDANGHPADKNDTQQPATPGAPPGPGAPGGPPAGPGGAPTDPLGPDGGDPLLSGGLPSDGLLGGLPGALGPALGATAGIPAALGSAIPGLGGGGLGDLGSALGSAIHDGRDPDHNGDRADELKDQHDGKSTKGGAGGDNSKPGDLTDQHQGSGTGQPPAAAGPGQPAAGSPAAAGPDLSVDVKGMGPIKADNPALAMAARQVLAGGNVHDEYNRANIALPPPGTPVMTPVSPAKTVFGDVGQYTNKQIMALGEQKAWVNGQVVDFDKIDFGPDFLGWIHQPMPAPAIPVAVTTPAPVGAVPPAAPSGLPGGQIQ
jgi:hypothetical protein